MNCTLFINRRHFPMIGMSVAALVVLFLLGMPARTQEQRAVRPAKMQTKAVSAGDVFLELAKSVGQTVPAKRLVEYQRVNGLPANGRYWSIVDFNQVSTAKRFYVFDTQLKRVDAYYVAHGKGSEGANDDGIAEVFSNEEGSNSSSLGIYRCLDEYNGNHGRSMRVEGLELTNSNALKRAVVLHTADYVSQNFIRQTGRLGRSDGCFAVESSVRDSLIDKLKNGAYIIAWRK
ncbi:MAG: murein L,D-transpeptidase catalytic domain-containing protein [Pyrinomonadaceae bacterium]